MMTRLCPLHSNKMSWWVLLILATLGIRLVLIIKKGSNWYVLMYQRRQVDPSPPDPDDESTLTTPPRSSPSTSQVAEIKQGAVDPEDQLNKARVALEQARANPKTSGAVLRTLQIDLRRKKKAYNVAN